MKIHTTKNYEESCNEAARVIADVVKNKPNANLGLATGRTALKVYEPLIKILNDEKISMKEVHTINLDEYIGMDPDSENSYRSQMNNAFFNHIDIDKDNTYTPSGINDVDDETVVFKKQLKDHPLDFQLLGTGVNGHIGFNEPNSEFLTAGVHTVELDEKTIQTNSVYFGGDLSKVPTKSITMGIGDILKAEKIVLIITGDEKLEVLNQLLKDDTISTSLPVSFLKTHRDVTLIVDEDLYEKTDKHKFGK